MLQKNHFFLFLGADISVWSHQKHNPGIYLSSSLSESSSFNEPFW